MEVKHKIIKERYLSILSIFLKKSRNIVVIGNYGSGNIGDESMLIALTQLIRKIGTKNVSVPSRNPEYYRTMSFKSIQEVSIPHGVLRLVLADTIIVGGGTLFSASAGIFMKAFLLLCILCKIMLKKVYFIGFGISRDTPLYLLPLLKLALKYSDGLILRDNYSYEFTEKLGVKNNYLLPDLVYCLEMPESPEKHFVENFDNTKKCKVGIILSSTIKRETYTESVNVFSFLFDSLIEKFSGKIYLFFITFSPGFAKMTSDMELNLEIIKNMRYRDDVIIIPYYPPFTTIQNVKKMDVIIGMRFHAKIFAHIFNIPLIGITLHDKDRAFAKETQLSNYEIKDIFLHEETRSKLIECISQKISKD